MKLRILPLTLLIILGVALGIGTSMLPRNTTDSGIAPSYDEIQRTIHHLTKRDIDPRWPQVDADGLIDPEIKRNMEAYEKTLLGKKVIGWRGWYQGYTGMEPGSGYNVGIFMQEPQEGKEELDDILIWEVPETQLTRLRSWYNAQPIVFSGVITKVWWSGQIWLNYVSIEDLGA